MAEALVKSLLVENRTILRGTGGWRGFRLQPCRRAECLGAHVKYRRQAYIVIIQAVHTPPFRDTICRLQDSYKSLVANI